jgi:hypothetical protein
MAVVTKQGNKLVVSVYPKCITGLVLLFLLAFWWFALTTTQSLETKDYILFSLVALVVIAIQKKKVTTLDKLSGRGCLSVKYIIGKSESCFQLDDIQDIMMVYGKGRYARGGAIYIQLKDQNLAIVDSDICLGNEKRNIGLVEEISTWLR